MKFSEADGPGEARRSHLSEGTWTGELQLGLLKLWGLLSPSTVILQCFSDIWATLLTLVNCIKFQFNEHIKLVFLKIPCLRTASPLPVKNMNFGVRSLSSCFRICQNILLDACETCPKSDFQSSNYYRSNSFLQHLIWDKPLSQPLLHVKLPPQSFNTE